MRRIDCAVLALVLGATGTISCRKAAEKTSTEVVAVRRATVPADPADAAWKDAPAFPAPLILQDMVEPRLLTASTAEVRVRAITDGARVAFRLEWKDGTPNDKQAPATFTDACAVQLPGAPDQKDVPAPQMGEKGKAVEITYWRASWQAVVDGRGDTIKDLHPNAAPDHYPYEAASLAKGGEPQREMEQRYSPARSLGNHMAGPRAKPVEDLMSEGPGTLSPGPSNDSNGKGTRLATGWAVVISRRLPQGLVPGGRSQVAFAVWEGDHGEVGARKMRTGWVPILMEGKL
ncbi:MAG: hypothetical protein JNK60_19785 [Acidobacteria bacterium]|nr:hypothetical protein [Acidobacteriota bacterium]